MKKNDEIDYEAALNEDISSVVSATECTGLMPIPPQDLFESESYSEIYTFPEGLVPPKNPHYTSKNKKSSKKKL